LPIARDDTPLKDDGINNPFERSSADAITNDNENPPSINIDPTTVTSIIIFTVKSKFLGITDSYLFIYINQFEPYHLKYNKMNTIEQYYMELIL
jgi:hypothetical protein